MPTNYKDITEFKTWENTEFGRLNWVRDSLSALVGLPAIGLIVSWGAAEGSVWGAGWASLGFLTGPMLGGIIGGVLAFIGAGAFAMWILPNIITSCLKLFRRLSSGSFNYRYNTHVAECDAKMQYDLIKLTAYEIAKLKQAKHLNTDQATLDDLTKGLNPIQKSLFTVLLTIYSTSKKPERTIKGNIPLAKLRHLLINYRLKEIRSHKKWALQQKQASLQGRTSVYINEVLNSVDAGHSPWSLLRFLIKLIMPKSPLVIQPQAPVYINDVLKERVATMPHLCIVDPKMTVASLIDSHEIASSLEDPSLSAEDLLNKKEREIKAFANRILETIREQSKRDLKAIEADIEQFAQHPISSEDQNQKAFLEKIHHEIQQWRTQKPDKHHKIPSEMTTDELKAYKNELTTRGKLQKNNFFQEMQRSFAKAQIDCLIEEQRSAPTVC